MKEGGDSSVDFSRSCSRFRVWLASFSDSSRSRLIDSICTLSSLAELPNFSDEFDCSSSGVPPVKWSRVLRREGFCSGDLITIIPSGFWRTEPPCANPLVPKNPEWREDDDVDNGGRKEEPEDEGKARDAVPGYLEASLSCV